MGSKLLVLCVMTFAHRNLWSGCLRTDTLFIKRRGSNRQFGDLSLPACGQLG